MICTHGIRIGAQGGIAQADIDSCHGDESLLDGLLAFYSACDCCDTLMHHSACGHGYFVMKDGRTLCWNCALSEDVDDFDGASPLDCGFTLADNRVRTGANSTVSESAVTD